MLMLMLREVGRISRRFFVVEAGRQHEQLGEEGRHCL